MLTATEKQTIRDNPPIHTTEVHSRTAVIKGHPILGIPQGSTVSISTEPNKRFVKRFYKTEEPEISMSLDPGKYTVVVRYVDAQGPGGMRWQESFFVGCDEDTYQKLAYAVPQMAKSRQTTQGIRYICGYMACKKTTTSRLAMVEHEAGHEGRSVLQEPMAREEIKHAVVKAGGATKEKKPHKDGCKCAVHRKNNQGA